MNVSMLLELPAGVAGEQPILSDDSVSVTYAQLRDRVARTASMLRFHGVSPGDRVGLFATSSVRAVEIMLAAAAIQAVVVPMNFRARHDEMVHLLTDSRAVLVFTEPRYEHEIRAAASESTLVVVLDEAAFAASLASVEPVEEFASSGGDAFLLYTSGTTALPKAVRLTHAALTSFALDGGEMADGSDRGMSLIAVPLYHVAGLTTLLVSLFTGRCTILQREFSPTGWLDAVERHRVTDAFLVPTMLKRILDEDVESRDLSSLRMVRYGAAPMPETVIVRALEQFPPTTEFLGAYGLTETTSTVAILGPDDHDLSGPPAQVEARRRRLKSVGRVLPDVEVQIRRDDDTPLPAGEVGSVCLRTARAMVGYAGEDGTAHPGLKWLDTGDLGRLDDEGYLFLVGRAGDLIIRGGENIAPAEVERVLMDHPSVSEVAVVGVTDEEWGQRVAAAVVVASGAAVSTDELVEFCRGRLAGFKRPERIVFVDELPHTSTGKLLRRRLLETVFA